MRDEEVQQQAYLGIFVITRTIFYNRARGTGPQNLDKETAIVVYLGMEGKEHERIA